MQEKAKIGKYVFLIIKRYLKKVRNSLCKGVLIDWELKNRNENKSTAKLDILLKLRN